MTYEQIETEVKRIVGDSLDMKPTDVHPGHNLVVDLCADSLGIVEIILATEESFELDIPDEDWEGITTVYDVTSYVARRLAVLPSGGTST